MSKPRAKLLDRFPGCPVEATLMYLDGKWKGVILYHLLDGTMRFNELRRKIPAVTQRMLTRQLRELEADGLISRTIHPVVPPHVDYALTDIGRSLEPVLRSLAAWGDRHVFCAEGERILISPKSVAKDQNSAIA